MLQLCVGAKALLGPGSSPAGRRGGCVLGHSCSSPPARLRRGLTNQETRTLSRLLLGGKMSTTHLVISPKRTQSLNLNSSPCNTESDNKNKNCSKRDCGPFAAPALFLTLCSGNVSTRWKITERAKSGHEQRACSPQLRTFSG